jgi:hypothetical protein
MQYSLYFAYEQYRDPRDLPNARIVQGFKKRLENMRVMVLYQIDQRKITQATIDVLERELSEIIGGIDNLRRADYIDELISSPGEVQTKVRNARRCLHVASRLLERGNTPRNIEFLFEKFEEFPDLLSEAIDLFNI